MAHYSSSDKAGNRVWHESTENSDRPSCIALRKLDVSGESRNVNICLVETYGQVRAACELINDRYAWRGYGENHCIPRSPAHATFTAEIDHLTVGTITLAIDSPSGLASDRCFQSEIDEFRNRGAKVCELTKLAFDATVQSKELLAALFHIVFVYGQRSYGCTDLFIEVNPRHVRFYEMMLGFRRIGQVKSNTSVAAPAQLMTLEVSAIREHINQAAGQQRSIARRSLYPFFFSPADEAGIYTRLAAANPKDRIPRRGASQEVHDRMPRGVRSAGMLRIDPSMLGRDQTSEQARAPE